jgi:hypothetical protein
MSGTIDGKQTTHDVDADWILKREYIRLHEVSREKDAKGGPAYEAIVFLSWDAKKGEYCCLWMDNTAGGALSSEAIAHGKPAAGAIPLVFTIAGKESLHTTFLYDAPADSWRLTIDDVTSGKNDARDSRSIPLALPRRSTRDKLRCLLRLTARRAHAVRRDAAL